MMPECRATAECCQTDMFLHLVHDDKFLDTAYSLFETVAPGENDFVTIGRQRPLRYIKSFQPRFVSLGEALSRRFLLSLCDYEAVFVHWLGGETRVIIERSPRDVRWVWFGWGGDYYHLINGLGPLILPKTARLQEQLATSSPRFGRVAWWKEQMGWIGAEGWRLSEFSARVQANRCYRRSGPGRRGEPGLLNRISVFAPVIYEDYELLSMDNPDFAPGYGSWSYGVLEDMVGHLGEAKAGGPNILVGNSATCENNHLEAFQILKGTLRPEQRIICPLSYGNAEYGRIVIERGRAFFGEQFVPLTGFMPIEEYVDILRSCSTAVMNHVRQQALGNIIIMLYLGAKLFLRSECPTFKFLKRLDLPAWDIASLTESAGGDPPPVEQTRQRLQAYFSRAAILKMTLRLIGQVHSLPTREQRLADASCNVRRPT